MTEEAKRLHKDLLDDPALAEKLKAILEEGSPEAQVRAIQKLGYQAERRTCRLSIWKRWRTMNWWLYPEARGALSWEKPDMPRTATRSAEVLGGIPTIMKPTKNAAP